MTERRAKARLVIRKRPDGRYAVTVPIVDGPVTLDVPTWSAAIYRANLMQTNGDADCVPLGWWISPTDVPGAYVGHTFGWRCLLCRGETDNPARHRVREHWHLPEHRVTYLRGGAR